MGHSFVGTLFNEPFLSADNADSKPGELVMLFDDVLGFYKETERWISRQTQVIQQIPIDSVQNVKSKQK